MKRILFILFCLTGLYAAAQDKKQIAADSAMLVNAADYFFDQGFFDRFVKKYNYAYDSIIFRDVRFDTSSIGATNKIPFLSDRNKFSIIKLSMGLSGFLNGLINFKASQEQNYSGDKLIGYIKKFRITELDSTYEYNARKERQLQIRAAVDVFLYHNNNLYPAFRTDTTFLQLLTENRKTYFIIDSLLTFFLDKVNKIDKAQILQKKTYAFSAVDSSYQKRFYLPVLTTPALKNGVYTAAKEFFNNAPSITEYEWKPDKKVNILYTKDEHTKWVVTRKNVFGFCDGTYIWIRVENNFYPAFRKGNTFEVVAPLLLKRIVNNQNTYYPVGGTGYAITIQSKYTSIYYKDKSVYQMDMETGAFY